MGYSIRDGRFGARASHRQAWPGGLLIVAALNLALWACVAALIVRAF